MKKREGKIVSTIECRMTSSRLPGKVLLDAIDHKSMLEIMVERVKQVRQVDEIVIATTLNPQDDPIEALARKLTISCFRGSEEDVLSRVLNAARNAKADCIVELTGDCPLIDVEIVSQIIDLYLFNECDYASNCEPHTYPIGMDTQVFSYKALEEADKKGRTQEDREHVSWYIRQNPDRFRLLTLIAPPSLHYPDVQVTLDEADDYKLMKKILEKLYPMNKYFSCYDILKLLRENLELLEINKAVRRLDVIHEE